MKKIYGCPENYKLTQEFKENEKEYTITIRVKIPKTKKGQYYIERMIKKQESAPVTILKEWEREKRKEYREGKISKPMYTREIFKEDVGRGAAAAAGKEMKNNV